MLKVKVYGRPTNGHINNVQLRGALPQTTIIECDHWPYESLFKLIVISNAKLQNIFPDSKFHGGSSGYRKRYIHK